MSGISSLYVGLSGLQANNNSLNTTANNLSNVNTEGYVRQQVISADRTYNTVSTNSANTTGQVGLGVSIQQINHVRDIFLDLQYRRESGREGFYQELYDSVYEIETQMGELDGVSFQSIFTNLQNSISELAKMPDDATYRSSLIENAISFIDRAQSVYNGLAEYQSSINDKIITTVNRINEIGTSILNLNHQISQIETAGVETAMDLRDTRDSLIDELAGYCKISYSEDASGSVTISIEGSQFVDNLSVNKMGLKVAEDDSGFVTPVWTTINNQNVFTNTSNISTARNNDIGSLKGMLIARGTVTPTYYNMTAPNADDYEGGTSDVNYIKDLNKYNQYVKSSETSTLVATMANVDKFVNTIVETINDLLCPDATASEILGTDMTSRLDYDSDGDGTMDSITVTGEDGSTYYISADTQLLNTNEASVGEDGTFGTELFSRTYCDRYTKVTDGTNTYYIRNDVNSFGNRSLYTINNISVNIKAEQDTSLIPLKTQDGLVDYDRADSISQLFNGEFLTYNGGNDTLTFEEFYEAMVDDVGNTGTVYKSMYANQTSLAASLDNQRQSVMSVSSDDELVNMVKYQQGYNAASRYINVISEMLETLIMRTGV